MHKKTLYILGTSNSILQYGYVNYLRKHYLVNNLSIGASPFYQYVFNICQIDPKKFYADNGIVLIENIVNDDNIFYSSELRAPFEQSSRQAILFAASRFPTVVVEILNKRHGKDRQKSYFSALYRCTCADYGIPFYSFNDILNIKYQNLKIDEIYADVSHITQDLAYNIAPHLVEYIDNIDWSLFNSKQELAVHHSSYQYLPIEGANELVGTSLRQLKVRSINEKDQFTFKGAYSLEAVVLDISQTNCVLKLIAGGDGYYQGFRYVQQQKPQFKVVAINPADCEGGVELQILSQKAASAQLDGNKKKTIHVSPHEDSISSNSHEAQARIVGFVVRNKNQNLDCKTHRHINENK